MAWDPTLPTNSGLLINAPAQIRANWDAIALGTDSNLLITNAKISPSAAIVDTKLDTIATAGKVSGAALTLLNNIPAGAGLIPVANIPTGTTANKILQLDASAKIPAVDGSQITTLSASQISTGTLAVARGGTGITNFICKVVSYTGNGTSQNIAHGFGALPSFAFILVTAGDTYPPGFWASGMANFLLITTIANAVATINATNLVLSDGTHYNISGQTYNLVMFGGQ